MTGYVRLECEALMCIGVRRAGRVPPIAARRMRARKKASLDKLRLRVDLLRIRVAELDEELRAQAA